MSGAILHNKNYFLACRAFEKQGDRVAQSDEFICMVFKVGLPAMSSSPYRGPIQIGSSFVIPKIEGGTDPALHNSERAALEHGIAMCDKNSW